MTFFGVWCPQSEQNKTSPLIFSSIFTFFGKKTTWVNAECRDASKNTLRTVGGLAHKKLGSYLCLAPYSHHTNWLHTVTIQSPYKLADCFKIHTIVRFDTGDSGLHHTKQGCFGRLTVRATSCTRNFFKKPCTFREILIFTCFGPVLYEGSMEGV